MKLKFALLACLLSSLGWAQSGPPGPPPLETSQLILPVNTGNLSPATQANVALVGNPGPQQIYYWLVTNYTLGQTSPVGPFIAINAPNTLSVSNYITVTPVYPAGASSIDLLKTSTPTPPSGACNCAVATGSTSGTINDQSNSTSSYTISPVSVSSFVMTIDNEVQGAGSTHAILRQNGVFVSDLSTGGGGGGAAFQVNSTPVINPSTINYVNAATTTGLNLAFTNPSLGIVQLGLSGTLTAPGGGTGESGTINGIPKANGSSAYTAAVAANVVSLFSGCSGTQYLGADGSCHNAGTGTITGSGTSFAIPLWSGASSLGNSLMSQSTTSGATGIAIPDNSGTPLNTAQAFFVNSNVTAGANTICNYGSVPLPLGTTATCFGATIRAISTIANATGVTTGLQVQNLSSDNLLVGINAYAVNQLPVTEIRGVESDAVAQNAATTNRSIAAYAAGVASNISTQQGVYVKTSGAAGGATITNNYGLYVDTPTIPATGTLTNNYGLFIADQASAGSGTNSNPFGIFEAGTAKNQLGGALTVPNLTDSALTSGNCVQAGSAGILTTTLAPCGSGGSLPSGSQSNALVNNNGISGYQTDQFSGYVTSPISATDRCLVWKTAWTSFAVKEPINTIGENANANANGVITCQSNPFPVSSSYGGSDAEQGGEYWLPQGLIFSTSAVQVAANDVTVRGRGIGNNLSGHYFGTNFGANTPWVSGTGTSFNPFVLSLGMAPGYLSTGTSLTGPFNTTIADFTVNALGVAGVGGVSICSGQENSGIRHASIFNAITTGLLVGCGLAHGNNGNATVDQQSWDEVYVRHPATGTVQDNTTLGNVSAWALDTSGRLRITWNNSPSATPGCGETIPIAGAALGGTHSTNINGTYVVAAISDVSNNVLLCDGRATGVTFTSGASQVVVMYNSTTADSSSTVQGTIGFYTSDVDVNAVMNRTVKALTAVANITDYNAGKAAICQVSVSGVAIHLDGVHVEESLRDGICVGLEQQTVNVELSFASPQANITNAAIHLFSNWGPIANFHARQDFTTSTANPPTDSIIDDNNSNTFTTANNPVLDYKTDGSGTAWAIAKTCSEMTNGWCGNGKTWAHYTSGVIDEGFDSTGKVTAASAATLGDGVHAAYVSLGGNTANYAVIANTAGFMAPSSASFTGYALQLPSTGPTPGSVFGCGGPSSGVAPCQFSETPTLGASGTIGTLSLGNATSGTVTLATVTGVLGAVTASLPANTGTISETNLAETFSAVKTFSSAPVISSITNTGTLTLPTATGTLADIIANGTSAMGTGGITTGTCATVVTTTATGAVTTDNLIANPTVDPTGVTGYGPSASGSLYIQGFITSGNVNFKVCNNTSGTITPAALTLQWRVER